MKPHYAALLINRKVKNCGMTLILMLLFPLVRAANQTPAQAPGLSGRAAADPPLRACHLSLLPAGERRRHRGPLPGGSDRFRRLRGGRAAAERGERSEAVRSGRADAAWIFAPDLDAGFTAFARYGSGRLITVTEREDNVFLMLSREKLYAALYPELSFALFRNYLVNEQGADGLTEAELRDYYDSGFSKEELIRFTYVDGTEIESDGRYLAAPLRGILALLLLLCGLASGMYCYREEREESFVWLSGLKRRLLPLLCHLTAMVPAALAILAALYLGGLWLGLRREALMLLLYLPCCALFCEILRCLSPREEHYGALIPILAVAVLVLCPVFVSLPFRLPFRDLLPVTWYLKASFSEKALGPMLPCLAAMIPLWALCSRLRAYLFARLASKD